MRRKRCEQCRQVKELDCFGFYKNGHHALVCSACEVQPKLPSAVIPAAGIDIGNFSICKQNIVSSLVYVFKQLDQQSMRARA